MGKFDAEWTMLAPHLQEVEKRSSIIFGKGNKPETEFEGAELKMKFPYNAPQSEADENVKQRKPTVIPSKEKSSSTDYRDEPARHEKITSEPKPRKIDLDDLVEGPNERQRQLETEPMEIGDFDSDRGDLISTLPDYDLPAQRQKTKLDEYSHTERERATKSKEKHDEPTTDSTLLEPHYQEIGNKSLVDKRTKSGLKVGTTPQKQMISPQKKKKKKKKIPPPKKKKKKKKKK